MTKTQCAHSSHSSRCHIEWQVIVRCCIYRSLMLNNSLISRVSQDTTHIQVKDRKGAKGLTSYITELMSCLAVKPGIWLFTLSNHLCSTHRTLTMEFWRTLSELHVNIRSNVTDQANTNLLIWYFAPLIRCEKLKEPNSESNSPKDSSSSPLFYCYTSKLLAKSSSPWLDLLLLPGVQACLRKCLPLTSTMGLLPILGVLLDMQMWDAAVL